MTRLEKILTEAARAKDAALPPLGLAPFLPLIETPLAAALEELDEKTRVDVLARFRENLAPVGAKDFRKTVAACKRCPKLLRPVVVGEGRYVRPRIAFYGEAPGKDEHIEGRPFIGAAGKLLRKTLGGVGIAEEEIWISNTVRCFPPGEGAASFRKPSVEEINNCRRYMVAEIEMNAPRLVVLLGAYSLQAIFPKASMNQERGSVKRVGAYQFLPTWHPSAVLRDRTAKIPEFEADLSYAAELTV